jgi:hypothetical protein
VRDVAPGESAGVTAFGYEGIATVGHEMEKESCWQQKLLFPPFTFPILCGSLTRRRFATPANVVGTYSADLWPPGSIRFAGTYIANLALLMFVWYELTKKRLHHVDDTMDERPTRSKIICPSVPASQSPSRQRPSRSG